MTAEMPAAYERKSHTLADDLHMDRLYEEMP